MVHYMTSTVRYPSLHGIQVESDTLFSWVGVSNKLPPPPPRHVPRVILICLNAPLVSSLPNKLKAFPGISHLLTCGSGAVSGPI